MATIATTTVNTALDDVPDMDLEPYDPTDEPVYPVLSDEEWDQLMHEELRRFNKAAKFALMQLIEEK